MKTKLTRAEIEKKGEKAQKYFNKHSHEILRDIYANKDISVPYIIHMYLGSSGISDCQSISNAINKQQNYRWTELVRYYDDEDVNKIELKVEKEFIEKIGYPQLFWWVN